MHALRRLLQVQSAHEPTVFVIDDAQWLDDESAELVGELADALGWTHTLLVLSARPEALLPGASVSYRRELDLGALGPQEVRSLIAELLGSDPSLGQLPARMATLTRGNPLFVEEMVRELVHEGALRGQSGDYRLTRPIEELRTPASVRTLLAARIDALPDAYKHVLVVASVIGSLDDPQLLAAAVGCPSAELARALDALRAAGLVADGRFSHPLIREAAYDAQLEARRRELHADVARALVGSHELELGRHAALIAHHWEAAHRPWIARRWRQRAALRVSNIQVRSY